MTSSTESVLLVQCCHLPQFFYLAKKLRQRHPEWNLSALVNDRPHVRSYLELFPPFDHLFFFDKNLPETLDAFDQILFPLLNRGYLRIKRAAWRLPGTAYEIDFQGERRALSPGTLVRSFARPLHRPPKEFVQYLEDFPPSPILSPILFFPTDEDSKAAEAIGRLHDPKVVSPQPIWVFCREDKRSFYQALPGVEEVRTYTPGRTWENLKAILALARSRADVVSSIFSPQPVFRLQKLLFVLFPARHRLAFNQDLNCYYLKGRHGRRGQPSVWGTLLRVLLTRSRSAGRTTLFFPTDEDSKAAEAIGRLHDPKIAAKSIVVFCREDKRSFYQALPTVEAVWTYAPGISLRHLKPWVRLLRTRVDLVCAVFSGRPIFLLQKFLFLTLRARNRLVFNEDLNCYMLRGHLAQFLQSQGGHRERGHSALIFAVRMALKGFLFVPRFLYLILWAAVVTVRARRRISKERRAANPSPDC